jgi:hypothetical protein
MAQCSRTFVRPNPKVVKGRGDRDLVEVVPAAACDRKAEVYDAMHVVLVGDEVVSKRGGMLVEHAIDDRDARHQ